jgi:multidrug efflux system outer membrane protein
MTASVPRRAVVLALAALLAACVNLQPRYERPGAPVPDRWEADPGAASGSPAASGIPWGDFFADARLRAAIDLALAYNRDLRVAALNIERARALYQIQRAQLYPEITATAEANSQRLPGDLSPSGQATVSRSVGAAVGLVSYELDLFGRIRSLNDQAAYQYLATEENRRAAQIALVAEVAGTWLGLATDLERLQLAQQTAKSQQHAYELVRRSNELGVQSGLEVRQAQVVLETARRDVALLTSLVEQGRNALQLLVGTRLPASLEPTAPLPSGVARVDDLPAGVPSEVLARRPDVRAAERLLQAANANIGAARANFFPRIALTASAGTASRDLQGLFEAGSRTWSFAPSITLPIFTGGANQAALDASEVDRDIAVARYERSIQGAFREVADALAQRGTIDAQLDAQRALVDALADASRLSLARFENGVDSYLAVLDAQRQLYLAQQVLVELRLARDANLVTLYKALGGGA